MADFAFVFPGQGSQSVGMLDAWGDHPAVREVAVIPDPDPKRIEVAVAVVVLEDGATFVEATLIRHARGLLADFKVPKHIHFVDQLPKNTAGKLLKRELRDRFAPTQ